MKLALAMIVKGTKDEAPLLDNCLTSIKGHVDAIYLDINAPEGVMPDKEVLAVAEKHGADVAITIWENNFVKARNNNFDRVPPKYDWITWLDADDTVDKPEKLKEVCSLASANTSGIFLNYDYDHDEYGNVTVSHYNARLVRNNGTFRWKSSFSDEGVTVHETLNEVRMVGKATNNEVKVIHNSNDERKNASLERNIKLLEGMLDNTSDNPDPRTLYYLATHYMDAGYLMRAKILFDKYLSLSGWAEERSQALVYLGDIYKAAQEPAKARSCYMRALAENPSDPSPYVELGELEAGEQLWKKAVEWLEMAVGKNPDQTVAIQRPMESTYRAYKLLSTANANIGSDKYETASEWLTKALKMRPFDPELLEAREQLDKLIHVRETTDHALHLIKELQDTKELDKIEGLLGSLPKELQDSPLFYGARNHYSKPKKWGKKNIAIVCGNSALGNWGPWSLETGIGGSEEAVVQLSKELTKLGWTVTVYATPGDRDGLHDGVNWRNYWEFNSKDTFDVLIGWRNPSFFDNNHKARKRFLWLHDVIDKEELIPERLNNLEGVIFVSEYHRTLFPMVPDSKAFASGNGIDPDQFTKTKNLLVNKTKRNNKKVVYMSAHERGQELLQRIWPDVVKAVPDAELHCYYGWSGYDHVNKNNPERMEWKQKLIEDMKDLPSFTDHGKIGHGDIVETIETAGVWAYPTNFPEVYCITAVKAQAGGAWPVNSDFAVLPETAPFGDKIAIEEDDPELHTGRWTEKLLEEYKQLLIHRLKNPPTDKEREEMMNWARNNMSWKKTAEGWDQRFK